MGRALPGAKKPECSCGARPVDAVDSCTQHIFFGEQTVRAMQMCPCCRGRTASQPHPRHWGRSWPCSHGGYSGSAHRQRLFLCLQKMQVLLVRCPTLHCDIRSIGAGGSPSVAQSERRSWVYVSTADYHRRIQGSIVFSLVSCMQCSTVRVLCSDWTRVYLFATLCMVSVAYRQLQRSLECIPGGRLAESIEKLHRGVGLDVEPLCHSDREPRLHG